jgi:putative hemolysin
MITLYIVLLVVCLLLSAFFSSSETAFISLQRAKLQHQVNTKVKGADRVLKIIQKPERLLSTVLLGNNLVNTTAAALATALAIHFIGDEEKGLLVATIGITVILLIFGETTPKTIATHHAERLARFYARPIEWLSWLLTPFVFILSWMASVFARPAGGKPIPRSLASEDEIRAMITLGEDEGEVEEAEAEMLHNIFEFTDRPVKEVMVPRPDVVFIEQGSQIKDFLAVYAESPLSRYPVFGENRDHVVGTLAIKDVLMALAKGDVNNDNPIDEFLRPPHFAPATKHIGELFREMRDRNFHLCVVVDEFGGTAGIVTINQLVEQIVGPMGDELVPMEKDFEVIDAHTFEIDGSMRVEEVNAEMALGLPEGDYETIAGFILNLLGRIPRENEQLRYRDLKMVIKEMHGVKIEKILLTREGHATTTS